ncbi:purine-nucleoside phosphorylase [Anaerosoma tenue]|uniref:purine-nucleoside phosphorylase n=1 Tax=Anaerosoma tenue TaxID=2933588 RepID=UPI002260CA52|nr:purine-nucleoside phosphorylase [Anaerosoma tenue]MCK8114581.1 purine-nucleoside phosphorylase [Anaerosoma tenue]
MSSVTLTVPDSDIEQARTVVPEAARVALVLGSGLSGLADIAEDACSLSYSDLEGFPQVGSVAGHAGRLVGGRLSGVPVALFQGRAHPYQGVSAHDASYPVRLAAALGCDTLIVTNAAGGVRETLSPGDIVLLSDQINLTGRSPLTGWAGPEGGTPFVPMRDAYDPGLRQSAVAAALETGVEIEPEGVYCGLPGPAYETPAEVAMLRTLGADLVGMSTVHEVVVARALGMRVLGFSLVTNAAAGVGLSHEEVLEAGRAAASDLTGLMLAILRGL